jgi:GTPase SAR1 family protein
MENTQCLTIYIVIYSISDRDSFINGTQTLYKLHENKNKKSLAVILVGNKADLQRKRRVSQVGMYLLAEKTLQPAIMKFRRKNVGQDLSLSIHRSLFSLVCK